jgi:V/A-type H+-transporting ATPase subunit A
LKEYFVDKVAPEWMELRGEAMALLQKEDELKETVRLVGLDALSYQDRITMEVARSIREDFLQQFAFHEVDTYTPIKKQYLMLKLVIEYYHLSLEALEKDVPIDDLISLSMREEIAKAKYVPEEKIEEEIEKISQRLKDEIHKLKEGSKV